MSDSFVLKVVDGDKIQIDVPDFARMAAQLDKLGIDADVESPSPAVLIVTLKAKMQ